MSLTQMEGGLGGLGGGWEPREVIGVRTQVGEGRLRLWKGEKKRCVGETLRRSSGQVVEGPG